MFSKYFDEWEVREEYTKEFVSLWPGWLGKENYHKLDEVTEVDWAKFNNWLRLLAKDFVIEVANFESCSLATVSHIENILSSYTESRNKGSSQFTKIVLPELGCVISEEWDYTYIIWHQNNHAVESLIPYITNAGLKHFHD
jgi:hypothetical protein